MDVSIIKVYNSKYGKWEKGARVVLNWSGLLSSGMSKAVYTDSDGLAEIQHRSSGQATIYINGKVYGKMKTPGSKTVTI